MVNEFLRSVDWFAEKETTCNPRFTPHEIIDKLLSLITDSGADDSWNKTRLLSTVHTNYRNHSADGEQGTDSHIHLFQKSHLYKTDTKLQLLLLLFWLDQAHPNSFLK